MKKITLVEFAEQFFNRPIPEYGRKLLAIADRIGYDEISQLDLQRRGVPYPSNEPCDLHDIAADNTWHCVETFDGKVIAEDKTLGDCIFKAAKALGTIK